MLTRRSFLTSAAATGVFFIPATRLFGQDLKGPASQQFRFAGIGVGGMGTATCNDLIANGGTIVALCDVDPQKLAAYAQEHPGIPTFTDYRVLFDKCSDTFDGVAISTPDHTHAIIALEAMRRGKAVYVQKPLARTFEECQLLMEEQARTGVVVQMGNQGHPGVARYGELAKENAWGEILELEGWSDRPVWPQGITAYPPAEPIPAGLDWDLWTGPSPLHAYSSQIHPFHWRGYWDYGCGAIGDMAVHNVDPAFWSFGLGLPTSVCATAIADNRPVTIAYPRWSTIRMTFAPTPACPKGVALTWYDGYDNGQQHLPAVPQGANPKYALPDNGLIVHGSKMTTCGASHASTPLVIAASGHAWNKETHDLQKVWSKRLRAITIGNHYLEFVTAAKAHDPDQCGSRLSYAAPLTQALLISCIALRYPGEELKFDPVRHVFTNKPEANVFLKATERGSFTFGAYRRDTRPWWRFW